MEDDVVLVDESGQECFDDQGKVRTAGKSEAHGRCWRHRAISVFVFNHAKQILLQRRAWSKYHSGGLWANTCCSHPRLGEAPADAARRRLWEEMRISCPLEELFQFGYCAELGNGLWENEYDHVFVGWSDDSPRPDPEEVAEWKWMDYPDLQRALLVEPTQYTYWLKQ